MGNTRVVRLRPGLLRAPERNARTSVRSRESLSRAGLDAHRLFVDRFASIRAAIARCPKQGVLVLAFDQAAEPIGELWLEADLDRSRAGILGRHSLCDLLIPEEHGGVSLRHAAILVRAVDLHDVRVRLIDLHTGTGFIDEAGRPLQAVSADGPAFLRIDDVDLVFLRTPEPGGFPDDPEAAYKCLPERVFDEEIEGVEEHPARKRLQRRGGGDQTIVRARSGPVLAARDLYESSDVVRGHITLRAGDDTARWRVGSTALNRGILIGRYERCHLGAVADADSSALSRVHLMVIADGDEILAIDTASTNGTLHLGREKRILALEDGDVLDLGGELELVWNAAS